MAVLATHAADIGHVPPIAAHGQPTFAGNLALLFRAHGRKPAPALLCPSGFGFRCPAPSHRALPTVAGAPGLGTAAGASALRRRAAARLIAFFGLLSHSTAAAAGLRASAGGALTIGLFGLDAVLPAVGAAVGLAVCSSRFLVRFSDGERTLAFAVTCV